MDSEPTAYLWKQVATNKT